jgi:hypothetical protein
MEEGRACHVPFVEETAEEFPRGGEGLGSHRVEEKAGESPSPMPTPSPMPIPAATVIHDNLVRDHLGGEPPSPPPSSPMKTSSMTSFYISSLDIRYPIGIYIYIYDFLGI